MAAITVDATFAPGRPQSATPLAVTPARERLEAYHSGLVAQLPFIVGLASWGLATGVAVAEAPINNVVGASGTLVVISGAAYLAVVTMLGAGAGLIGILLTVAVMNSRFLVYSASLGPRLRDQPAWFRVLVTQTMTDNVFAMTFRHLEAGRPASWVRWHYLGLISVTVTVWPLAAVIGASAGPVIPQSWDLTMAGALLLTALVVPTLADRAAVIAAVTGATVAVALLGAPHGLHLVAGTVVGTTAGVLSQRLYATNGAPS